MVAGASHSPVAGFMLPPVADQTRVLVIPPVTVALKVVELEAVTVGLAGLMGLTARSLGSMVKVAVATVPAALVTVSVKVLGSVMMPLLKGVPLVTTPTRLSTLPVPLLKVGVIWVEVPRRTGFTAATRVGAPGAATMTGLAVPAAEAVPAALVATQLSPTAPDVPGVKVMLVVPAPAVMLPLVMDQARVMPAWAVTEAT